MSERPRRVHPEALALARWMALLMGWVWLGAQGQRLGWSVASGVMPVALWWALRLLLAHASLAERLAPAAAPLLGALTALGVLLVGQWQTPATGHAALLVLAALWAAWSAALETPVARGACRRRWWGLPPLLAAALTALCTAVVLPAPFGLWAAPGVLLLAAVLGQRSKPLTVQRSNATTSSCAASAVPATAMGLMMGTLWLSNAWCSAAGWSPASVVVIHLGLMAVLPAFTRLTLVPRHIPALWADRLPLALVVLGAAVLLAGTGAAHGVVGMGLLALAWSVHAGRQRAEAWSAATVATTKSGAVVAVVRALSGPALLLAVGWLSPTSGPWAQQLAYGLIGAAAMLALVFSGWRTARPRTFYLPIPLARSDSA